MLFNNAGGKIKILAWAILFFGVLMSIFIGMYLLLESRNMGDLKNTFVVSSMAVFFFGSLLSYFISLIIYGFGSLVENSDKHAQKSNT